MGTTLYISFFDGNDSRKIATTKAAAIQHLLDRRSDEIMVSAGYDNITTVITLDDTGAVYDIETVDLADEAEDVARAENEALEAERREDAEEEAWHRERAA